jgi:hypothetical protein
MKIDIHRHEINRFNCWRSKQTIVVLYMPVSITPPLGHSVSPLKAVGRWPGDHESNTAFVDRRQKQLLFHSEPGNPQPLHSSDGNCAQNVVGKRVNSLAIFPPAAHPRIDRFRREQAMDLPEALSGMNALSTAEDVEGSESTRW